ncbi:MAG: acyl-CoA dehydrogenase [Candidatus Lokiarchaeota archaeon]|nr:acyl-CoA dehydrogenase [Candidatus Lokiarchaeota archaeon]
MDLSLTEQEKMVQSVVREFAEKEVGPIAAEIDKTERFPTETLKKMQKLGLYGLPYPKEYGGAGGSDLSYYLAIEELSKKCATTSVILAAPASLCAWPIMKYGNEDQKEKYFRAIVEGKRVGGFALTEPGAGTDSAMQQTTATLEGDHYVINGSKCFITGAGQFEFFVVMAMTDKTQRTRGISAFIVEANTPGFSVGKIEDKLGIRASATGELIFEDMKVPKECLLGKEGEGFKIAMQTLDGGRIGIAAQALGIAEGAMEESVKYIQERVQFGKPIGSFQGIQWYIAEMETKINAARGLMYDVIYKKQKGIPFSKEASMAKLFSSEMAMWVTDKAIQLHGGYGFTKDYPVERMHRDAKITEIYEGTSEVQKMVIASHTIVPKNK